MKIYTYILCVILLMFFTPFFSQNDTTNTDSVATSKEIYVQISGIVVTGKQMLPVPFVTVFKKETYRGTSSDFYGFFSFVGEPGDTLVFSSIGYRTTTYVVPDTLKTGRYSLIQELEQDTVLLSVHKVYPWPSREQFKDAFLNTNIPNDDLTRAQNNLNKDILAFKQEAYPAGGSVNYKWQMSRVMDRKYYAGQAPPNNLLNPFAWAKFIQSWKNGELKK